MKKTIFIALTLVLGGMTAQAADLQVMSLDKVVGSQDYEMVLNNFDAVVNTTSDKFQQLVDLAHKGQSVSFSDVEGVYTGRCYDMVNRNLPRSSALLVIQQTTNEGPLFPTEKLVIEGGYYSSAPDEADGKTKEQLKSDMIQLKSYYSTVVESPLSVVMSPATTKPSIMSFSKSETYIVSTVVADADQEINVRGDGKFTVKKGDVWAACYYFNKK